MEFTRLEYEEIRFKVNKLVAGAPTRKRIKIMLGYMKLTKISKLTGIPYPTLTSIKKGKYSKVRLKSEMLVEKLYNELKKATDNMSKYRKIYGIF